MSDHPSKEFQAFTSLMDKLVKVPKSALDERMAHHRRKTAENRAENPMRAGRKPKQKPPENDVSSSSLSPRQSIPDRSTGDRALVP